MAEEYLTMELTYDIKKDTFEVGGSLNENGRLEVVENFLRDQMGKGRDGSTPNKKDLYHIELRWFPENDNIESRCDTGNKGLREGILLEYLRRQQ